MKQHGGTWKEMNHTRWNIFNPSGQITAEITNETEWYSNNLRYPELRGEVIRHRRKNLDITGPNWQIVGVIEFQDVVGSEELGRGRSPTDRESFTSNFDILSPDGYVRLNLYVPGHPRLIPCLGRVREYIGYMRGRNWSYDFIFTVQTIFRDIPRSPAPTQATEPAGLPREPAPVVGPSEVTQNTFHDANPVHEDDEPDIHIDEDAMWSEIWQREWDARSPGESEGMNSDSN